MISKHNSKVTKNAEPPQNELQKLCNCRKKEDCPLQGQCLKKELVYQATVTSEGGNIGNTFKKRYTGHLHNIKHENSNGTTLSAHIWKLKKENKKFEITWKILKHAKPFTPVSAQCALCTAEKSIIIFKQEMATLNTRNELGSHCKHKKS